MGRSRADLVLVVRIKWSILAITGPGCITEMRNLSQENRDEALNTSEYARIYSRCNNSIGLQVLMPIVNAKKRDIRDCFPQDQQEGTATSFRLLIDYRQIFSLRCSKKRGSFHAGADR